MSEESSSKGPAQSLLPVARLARLIVMFRGESVMLDRDLAELYGVEIRALNQAVRRNRDRFPADFAFELSRVEIRSLAKLVGDPGLSRVRGVFAFTEQGVAMLSSVLRSPRAVLVNIEIMRTFVALRRMLSSHEELSRKLAALERRYDTRFKSVFDAIRELMRERKTPPREIGFHTLLPSRTGRAKSTLKSRKP